MDKNANSTKSNNLDNVIDKTIVNNENNLTESTEECSPTDKESFPEKPIKENQKDDSSQNINKINPDSENRSDPLKNTEIPDESALDSGNIGITKNDDSSSSNEISQPSIVECVNIDNPKTNSVEESLIEKNLKFEDKDKLKADQDKISTSENIKDFEFQEKENSVSKPSVAEANEKGECVPTTYSNLCESGNFDNSDTSALMKLAEIACETNVIISTSSPKPTENDLSSSEDSNQDGCNSDMKSISKDTNNSIGVPEENSIENKSASGKFDDSDLAATSPEGLLMDTETLESTIEEIFPETLDESIVINTSNTDCENGHRALNENIDKVTTVIKNNCSNLENETLVAERTNCENEDNRTLVRERINYEKKDINIIGITECANSDDKILSNKANCVNQEVEISKTDRIKGDMEDKSLNERADCENKNKNVVARTDSLNSEDKFLSEKVDSENKNKNAIARTDSENSEDRTLSDCENKNKNVVVRTDSLNSEDKFLSEKVDSENKNKNAIARTDSENSEDRTLSDCENKNKNVVVRTDSLNSEDRVLSEKVDCENKNKNAVARTDSVNSEDRTLSKVIDCRDEEDRIKGTECVKLVDRETSNLPERENCEIVDRNIEIRTDCVISENGAECENEGDEIEVKRTNSLNSENMEDKILAKQTDCSTPTAVHENCMDQGNSLDEEDIIMTSTADSLNAETSKPDETTKKCESELVVDGSTEMDIDVSVRVVEGNKVLSEGNDKEEHSLTCDNVSKSDNTQYQNSITDSKFPENDSVSKEMFKDKKNLSDTSNKISLKDDENSNIGFSEVNLEKRTLALNETLNGKAANDLTFSTPAMAEDLNCSKLLKEPEVSNRELELSSNSSKNADLVKNIQVSEFSSCSSKEKEIATENTICSTTTSKEIDDEKSLISTPEKDDLVSSHSLDKTSETITKDSSLGEEINKEKEIATKNKTCSTAKSKEKYDEISLITPEKDDLVSSQALVKDSETIAKDSSLREETNKESKGSPRCPKIFIRTDLQEIPSNQNYDRLCSDVLHRGVTIDGIINNVVDQSSTAMEIHTISDDSSEDNEKLVIDEERTGVTKKRKTDYQNVRSQPLNETITCNSQSNLSSKPMHVKSSRVEVVDLVDADKETSNEITNKCTEDMIKSKSFICDKCKDTWNDRVLKLLFEGNESVTINSRITYGAIICMNIYVSIHYPSIKEQALIGLLDRADLAKNLGSIQVSLLNSWLIALIKNKKIGCCDPFRPVYRAKTSNRSAQQNSDGGQNAEQNQIQEQSFSLATAHGVQTYTKPKTKPQVSEIVLEKPKEEKEEYSNQTDSIQCNKENSERTEETASMPKTSDTKNVLTNEFALTRQFAKTNPILYSIIQKERESLSSDLHPFYDKLYYESSVTEEDAKSGKKKFLTNKEVLCAHTNFILNAHNIELDKYFKFLFQILHHREHLFLIPDGKSLVKLIEGVRKEHNRKKFSMVKNKNFLSQIWDQESLYTAPLTPKLKNDENYQPTIRDILGTFCHWKNHNFLNSQNGRPNLKEAVLTLYGNKIHIEDCFGLCIKLYAEYLRHVFEEGEGDLLKTKMFLSLHYLPKSYLDSMNDAVTFPSDISFLPPTNGTLSDALTYLENQAENKCNQVKRCHPDSLIDYKIQQTKKLRKDILFHAQPKAVGLLDLYARLKNELNYLKAKPERDSSSEDSNSDFAKAFNSYTPEVKLMAAKLRAANVDAENIPAILESFFHKIFKRKVPLLMTSN